MIHIIRHKDYDFPIPTGYVTCEVGPLFKESPREFSYIERSNVNKLNPIINELTGVIDVAFNFDDPVVGFCHYHRFFTMDDKILDYNQLKEFVFPYGDYDFVLAQHVTYPDMTIRQSLERDFREDLPTFNKYMDMFYKAEPGLREYFDGNTFHPRNMFVCNRNKLYMYTNFIYGIVIPIAERFKEEDFNKYHHYYSRMIGFIAERLLTYVVLKYDLKYTELPYNEF